MNRPTCKHSGPAVCISAALLMAATPAGAQPTSAPAEIPVPKLSIDPRDAVKPSGKDLTGLSLEDLLKVRVTIASKQEQALSDVAAAVTVLTADDINRLRYSSIPELLRTVPGLFAAQIDASTWSVGARGGANRYTNNLLVMVDGRSVYTPDFSGVYWSTVDYVMADLDRIEVIRGPGATLWGANAVNGVINIVTKDAKDTQGFLIDSYAGTDGYINSVRYGGKIDDNIYFRVYGKSRGMGDFEYHDGAPASDGWDQYRSGFRMDIQMTAQDKLTVQGDIFDGRMGANINEPGAAPAFSHINTGPFNVGGGNVLARFTHTFSETSDLTLQIYYDSLSNLTRPEVGADSSLHTVDLDIQHRFALGDRQEIIWGGGYRIALENLGSSPPLLPTPAAAYMLQIASGFIQDDLTLIPKRLHVIGGTKVEYDSVVGTAELQPSIRAIWTPDDTNTFWTAISRAARTPGLSETAASITYNRVPIGGGQTLDIQTQPNAGIRSEHLMAYEIGYRAQPAQSFCMDISGFYDITKNARENIPAPLTFRNGTLVQPVLMVDDQTSQAWGLELGSTWEISDKWKVSGSYSYLNTIQFGGAGMTHISGDPQHQVKVRTYYDITKGLDVSSELFWIGRIKDENIPSFFRWDASLGWRPEKHTEISIGVRNILDSHHLESSDYGGATAPLIEAPRTFFVQLEFKF